MLREMCVQAKDQYGSLEIIIEHSTYNGVEITKCAVSTLVTDYAAVLCVHLRFEFSTKFSKQRS